MSNKFYFRKIFRRLYLIKKLNPDQKKIQGMSGEEILNFFYHSNQFKKNKYGWQFKDDINFYKAKILSYDFLNSNTGKIIFEKGF